MTITTPSLEQFLAEQNDHEDDDLGEPIDPLTSIAESLRSLVATVEKHEVADSAESQLQNQYDELDRAYAVLEEQKKEAWALLERVLEICKPSTSKLANSIRALLEQPSTRSVDERPVTDDPAPAGYDLDAEQPDDNADVWKWRAYARSQGYAGPDVDQMNRSQIRTMLGIPHAEASS